MNKLKRLANQLQEEENKPLREKSEEQREARVAVLQDRLSVADSEPFRRVKVKIEEMLEDGYRGAMDGDNSLLFYRWQGAERALRGLLGWFEGARSELMKIQEADDAVKGPVSAPA